MSTSSIRLAGRVVDGRRSLGRAGEELAGRFCEDLGMTLVTRNWRCRLGELDLVLIDGDWLVVCEVKTRRSEAFGHPLEAISAAKLTRLRHLAGQCARELGPPIAGFGLRLDVIGILWPVGATPVVRHVGGVG